MKKTISLILAVIFTAALALSVFAEYPKSDTYIYDGAEMLSAEAETEIKSVSDALFVSKGLRIAVCAVDNTGDVPAKTYARGVFGEWEVKGVLLLLVKSTDYYFAVQSSSISEVLTDEKLSDILKTTLESDFSAGNYSAGVSATVRAFSNFLTANIKDETAQDQSGTSQSGGSKVGKFFKGLLIVVLILAVLVAAGYGLLVYLEKKQERERRLLLEEKRRRLAREGRGNYYGDLNGQARGGVRPGANNQGQRPQGQYGQYRQGAQRNGGQGGRDRFVYPNDPQTARPAERQQAARRNGTNTASVRAVPPRGQRVDFDKEYYGGASADTGATREFTRH